MQAALLKYTFRVSLARSQARSREPVTQAVMFVTAHGGLTALGGPVTPAGRLQSRLESRLGSRLEPRRAVTPSVSAVEPELQPGAGHGSFALSANPKPEAGPYLTQTAASQAGQNDPARSCPACLWPAGTRARAGTAQASRLARVRGRDHRREAQGSGSMATRSRGGLEDCRFTDTDCRPCRRLGGTDGSDSTPRGWPRRP